MAYILTTDLWLKIREKRGFIDPFVCLFVSHIDTVSGCFSLCVIHNAFNTIPVPKQKIVKDIGCIKKLKGQSRSSSCIEGMKDKTGDILIL